MSSDGPDYFSAQRKEIEERGFLADDFLDRDADCPVFGLNLACAHPFPASVKQAYDTMASRLAALGEAVYVYPFWETHVTIMTFINFTLHRRPSPELLHEIRSLAAPIVDTIRPLFDTKTISPFTMEFGPPALSRKAAILPVANPTGEIARIRQRAAELLKLNPLLYEALQRKGFSVPGIIHSTIMRFKTAPPDSRRMAEEFDAVSAATAPFAFTVPELLVTTETKPYMRAGEVLHRFPLADGRSAS